MSRVVWWGQHIQWALPWKENYEKKTLAKRNINSLTRESEKLKHRKKKYIVRGHGPHLRKIIHKYWILSDLAAEQYICIMYVIYVKKKQKGKF